MADRLELEARFNDHASAGVKKLGKTLEGVKPSNGMAAAQKWMGDFKGAAEKANVAVRPVVSTLTALGVGGLAASMSMSELVKAFKGLADNTLDMKELGRQTGTTMDQISQLQYAAGKLHVDPAAVAGAISGWSSKMVEFRRHTGRFYTELLRQNSDVARRIAADNPVDGLKDTLDFLSRIKDPQVQKRWADEAGVGDLTPMLGKGPQGLAEAFADAAREVKPISAEMQAAADRFNDATNRFNQVWSNLKNDLGPAVLAPLAHAVDSLDDTLKVAAKFPGDAVALAGVFATGAATLYARYRIMRGSALAGGGGAMGRAAGEMAGAAAEQKVATTTFVEAVAEFRLAVREMAARGAGSGGVGGVPGESGKTGEGRKAFGKGGKPGRSTGSLIEKGAGALAVYQLAEIAQEGHMLEPPKSFDARGALDFLDPNFGNMVLGPKAPDDDARKAGDDARASRDAAIARTERQRLMAHPLEDSLDRMRAEMIAGGPSPTMPASASDKWNAPSAYDREARARRRGTTADASNHDGNPLHNNFTDERGPLTPAPASAQWEHPDDDRLSRARPDDLRTQVKQGSKEGIIAGLREMAQEQDLEAKGGGNGFGAGGTGAINFRYGRNPASGSYRRTPGASGGRGSPDGHAPQGPLHFAGFGSGGWEKAGANKEQVAGYIRQAAAREGVDPETAVRVAQSEGLGVYRGDYGTSFGPFQLHYGGSGIKGMNSSGLGDSFTRETGLDARDPTTWKAQVDYAMKQARRGGWTPWHGAARVGIGPRQGIGVRPIAPAPAPAMPGAGTPVPSGAAIGDAERFAAQQRLINGSRDPKDRAIINRYLREHNPPNGHRAGGWIRGSGTGTSDSIPARLSHGEYVVNARASGQWGPLLEAINEHRVPAFRDGGPVRGSSFSPEGRGRIESWMAFLTRKVQDGGMGATWRSALGTIAMMQGESGRNLDPKVFNPNDVDGPSGGSAQWHDVMKGRWAGKLHRFSDLLNFANSQHRVWTDLATQQQFFRKEALGSMAFAWNPMNKARTAPSALKQGIDKFENPAQHDLEFKRRQPNIVRMVQEHVAGLTRQNAGPIDPLEVNIRHHPHTGRPIVSASSGKGIKLKIRTAPTMRPT